MRIMEIDNDLATLVTSSLKIREKKRRLTGNFVNAPSMSTSEDPSEDSDVASPEKPRRSARKKFRPLENEKRRVNTKPKKLVDKTNLTEVYNYYLDKKVKRLPPTLETIFEEPQEKKDEVQVMSTRKFKRCITFSDASNANRLKSRRRLMKARKVTAKQRLHTKKLSMDLLIEKLQSLSDSEDESKTKAN